MKKSILIISTLLFTGYTIAQNVTIPDANFKAYLLGNTSINTNSDSEIQVSEAINFSGYINCPNQNISDLTGIEAFINIEGLTCNDNNLTSLNLSFNLNLVQVICRNNLLTSLNLGNNTTIINLFTENNQLASIDVSSCVALNSFECNSNQITNLDLSNNLNLLNLRCSYNQLISLNLGGNTSLHTLIVDDNPISSLNVLNNTGLSSLWFSNTGITSLDLSPLNNLVTLNCSGTPITELDLSDNTQLTEVYCFDTPLQSLNLANGNNNNLNYLWIHNNPELVCVEVDDEFYSNTNWVSGLQINEDPFIFDASLVFSEDCASIMTIAEKEVSPIISLFPNPTSSEINITTSKFAEIAILAVTGQEIIKCTVNGSKTLDISNLESGVYFIKDLNSSSIYKFIKE